MPEQRAYGESHIVYEIPRILSDETMQAVKEKIEFNRTWNRKDIKNKYLLRGFIRCGECGRTLMGQTQKLNHGRYDYIYYRHKDGRYRDCRAFNSIKTKKIEDAVFRTIFENTIDEIGFQKAIKGSLPDEKYVDQLQDNISKNGKRLKKIDRDIEKLVDAVLNGTLKRETITKKEAALYEAKAEIAGKLVSDRSKLKSLPSKKEITQKAEHIRLGLQDYFGSEERLNEMSFDERIYHII